MARSWWSGGAEAQLDSFFGVSGYRQIRLNRQNLRMGTAFHGLWPTVRLGIITIIFGWSPGADCASGVTDVRFWYGPDKTRLVLELTSAVTYRVFSLEDPERIVIDIDEGQLNDYLFLPA